MGDRGEIAGGGPAPEESPDSAEHERDATGAPSRSDATIAAELQTILDSVPAYIWFKDADNRILRVNRVAAQSMDMSPNEMEGRSTYDLYPEEAQQYHRDDLEVIRTGVSKLGILEPLHIGDRKLWISTDKVPYRDQNGTIIGVIVFSVDVTERVLAEEALRRARDELEVRVQERTAELAQVAETLRAEIGERRKAEEQIRRKDAELAHMQRVGTVESIAAQLAHEMNQPLAAIVNFARGLRRRLQDGTADLESSIHVTDQISKQAVRAAEVVHRLREFIGRHPPHRAPCDLGRVIKDAVALIETEARGRNVRVRTKVDVGLDPVDVDQVRIAQVVLNLVRNALDATVQRLGEAGAEILVRVLRDEAWIAVEVVDEGCGLPPGDAEAMFEPFYTTKENGLGMGLTISHAIVAAHGGTLRASDNRGPGATFTFTIPND
jgi:PAS domain S-box-containing protein